MTTLTLQPGLRSALPPTLQPHAVLSIAPPTDRRRSLAASLAVYALVGGGALWLGHARAVARQPLVPVGPVVLLNPLPASPALPAFHPPAPARVPSLAPPPVMPSQLIPDAPAALPTQDRSNEPPAEPSVAGPSDTAAPAGGPITLSGDAVRILRQVNPVYPSMAMAAHLQGQVVIRMTIDAQGLPSVVEAVSGPQVFHEPALRAARQWRFEPARQNGEPVPATFLLTLNFVLR